MLCSCYAVYSKIRHRNGHAAPIINIDNCERATRVSSCSSCNGAADHRSPGIVLPATTATSHDDIPSVRMQYFRVSKNVYSRLLAIRIHRTSFRRHTSHHKSAAAAARMMTKSGTTPDKRTLNCIHSMPISANDLYAQSSVAPLSPRRQARFYGDCSISTIHRLKIRPIPGKGQIRIDRQIGARGVSR